MLPLIPLMISGGIAVTAGKALFKREPKPPPIPPPAAQTKRFTANLKHGGQIVAEIAFAEGYANFENITKMQGVVSRWALDLEYPSLSMKLYNSLENRFPVGRRGELLHCFEVVDIALLNPAKYTPPVEKISAADRVRRDIRRKRDMAVAAIEESRDIRVPDYDVGQMSLKDRIKQYGIQTAESFFEHPDKL
jgi:hypothetical protein